MHNKINEWTIGSDPEFAAVDVTGTPRSVIGLIPGTKHEIHDLGSGFGCQQDNVMAELTIPPTDNKNQFVGHILHGKQMINDILQEHGLQIKSLSSARYSNQDLDNEIAQTFGCDPSFCVYTRGQSPRPSAEEVGNLRSAGTHIHIGTKQLLTIPEIEYLMHCMDIHLGIPSLLIDQDEDRRKLYGNAGDFRFNQRVDPLTIAEYRTLGGFFTSSKELIEYLYDQTQAAIDHYTASTDLTIDDEVKRIIDEADYEAAARFVELNKINVITVHAEVTA